MNLGCSHAREATIRLDAGGAMTPSYEIGQQDVGFFGPFSDG